MKKTEDAWIVYILECGDGTLYTGITNNLDARIEAHESGKGAKYTKGRGPFKLFYSQKHKSRSDASRRELEIKSLDRAAKIALKQADAGAK